MTCCRREGDGSGGVRGGVERRHDDVDASDAVRGTDWRDDEQR
jgi:hypothetical protein